MTIKEIRELRIKVLGMSEKELLNRTVELDKLIEENMDSSMPEVEWHSLIDEHSIYYNRLEQLGLIGELNGLLS